MKFLFNTLSQKKEKFLPRQKKRVNLFVCGPTVYDSSHLGHARTYIIFDVFAKYLKSLKFNVFYLQNITDVDDKVIRRANESGKTTKELSRFFEKEYSNDMKALRVNSVTKYARATDYIKEIEGQIEKLIQKGFAYQIEDGVYYDITKFKEYGKLSGRTALQAEDAVSRIDENKGKKNRGDFCLWKAQRPNEPFWQSPWGPGRPGWHIEDTAITESFFGTQYDIHGGGIDLIFPHHESEIAQEEALSGKKPMVKYWMHTGFLMVGGQKMSKSLGNFVTIKDFLKNHSAQSLRMFILSTLYRSPVDYTEKAAIQAKSNVERLKDFVSRLKNQKIKNTKSDKTFSVKKFEEKFYGYLADDFNTPRALSVVFDLIKKVNFLIDKNKISQDQIRQTLDFLTKFDKIFEILPKKKKQKTPDKIQELVKQREGYRLEKNWQAADEIREELKTLGYIIEDTPSGTKISKI